MPLTNEQHQVILNSLMQQCGCPTQVQDRLEAFTAGMMAALNGIRDKITLDEGAITKPSGNGVSAKRIAASANRLKEKRK